MQEVIFILTNYGGQDKQEFLGDMKNFKTLKFDVDEGETAGIDTLQIEIPIEARKELLERAEDAIFKLGMGVNPTKEDFSNTSGAALKFIYSLLELKAGITETEFRLGFDMFMEFVKIYLGVDVEAAIDQKWKHSSIQNLQEQATVLSQLSDITSKENIAINNPLVLDGNWEEELKLREEEGKDSYEKASDVLETKVSGNQAKSAQQVQSVRDGIQKSPQTSSKGN